MTSGVYIVQYSLTATGATEDVTTALYLNGSEIQSSTSGGFLQTATDQTALSGQAVQSITETSTIDLRNNGTTAFTADNVSISVIKIA